MSEGNSHFLSLMGEHQGGTLVEQIDEKLRDVVAAVRRNGGKGSLTIKIDFKPNGSGGRGIVATPVIKTSAPVEAQGDSFWFADPNDNLTRNPPPDEMQRLFEMKAESK